ncbi:M48 family metallopeptidase [Chitinimonas naiadis]
MDSIYPAGPANVPADLTKANRRYKQKAWLAMAGLGLFVLLYCCLSGWFAWQAWRLLRGAILGTGGDSFVPFIVGGASAFLAVFMLKALFFIKHGGGKSDDVEVTAKDEPTLFEFLHRLADEAGAPRPHRVFLSARVNASVFYDLSILNLLWPSRKNLEIGLALVNVLTLGELKAVLAHEFGHFAQRSMAVGRWVYIAQQIAGQIISKRDALDKFLQALSNFDFRIAWIGWLMSLIVWAIRTLLETAFRLVVLAQRALSREMEMQADLVAVSLTGSDALIHALHKMEAADDAWDRTLSFANGEFGKGRKVEDLFAIQSRVIAHLRVVFNDPGYGKEPPGPTGSPDQHRVFSVDFARPPQMWATHPLNHEREQNAKRVYLAAPVDPRSAWALFTHPAELRKQVSDHLIKDVEEKPEAVALETSLQHLDELFQREDLNRFYRGAYLGRSVVRGVQRPEELYQPMGEVTADSLAALYPESLAPELEQLRNLEKEKAMLESLHAGTMAATDGVIRHRGQQLRRRQLPQVIEQVGKELAEVESKLAAHDRQCRSLHRTIAAKLGGGWESYLLGLASTLHYAEHTEADLRDAHGLFSNIVAVETATGKVSSDGVKRVVAAANQLHAVMSEIDQHREAVQPDPTVLARMEVDNWSDALGKFDLVPASKDNINDWVKVIDGWVNSMAGTLSSLRRAALCQLLSTEAKLAREFREGQASGEASAASTVPQRYATLLPRQERKRQTKLGWWARFQRADGPVATVGRLAVSLGIVGTVLGFGGSAGMAHVVIYNGLARAVVVQVNEQSVELPEFGHDTVEVPTDGQLKIAARTQDGHPIESFPVTLDGGASRYVYNIAGASPLVEWTATYGSYAPVAPRKQGAPRWMVTPAEILFEEPPRSISTKSGGGTRTVLSGLGDLSPGEQLGDLDDAAASRQVILAHARWDSGNSTYAAHWLYSARKMPEAKDLMAARLKDQPADVITLRTEQDNAGEQRDAVCQRQRHQAEQAPDNPDLQYVAARCISNISERNQAFLAGAQRWPNNAWFTMAAGYTYAERMDWPAALERMDRARKQTPVLADFVGLDVVRIYRLLGKPVPADLLERTASARQLMALESGEGVDKSSPMIAYTELGRGEFDAALSHAGPRSPLADRLLRFAAASDGASTQRIMQALALDPKHGLDNETAWAMLALGLREKADTTAYRKVLDEADSESAKAMIAFADAVASGAAPAEAEKRLVGVSIETRASAYAMGLILLGKRAPDAWRTTAKQLLFPSERPYFS